MKTKAFSIFEKQKELQKTNQFGLKKRKQLLETLIRSILDSRLEIHKALAKDLGKSSAEADMSEIFPIRAEAKLAIRKLKKWAKPKKVASPITLLGYQSYIYPEPKGLVLIISSWNFPFNLTFSPMISALAAGNRIILKTSEHSSASSALMKKIISANFSPSEVALFTGDQELAQELLSYNFDHIFFTGNPTIGKKVMALASKNLSSVTLELGGKSPAIVDETANINLASSRLAWSKFMNNGQICIAPDYLFLHSSHKKTFLKKFKNEVQKLYGKDIESLEKSKNYGRIINLNHHKRILSLLKDAKKKGAKIESIYNCDWENTKEKFIPPLLLFQIPKESRILKEEIFGPVFPILIYNKIKEVHTFIQEREKPLALYLYSNSKKNIQNILKQISVGGVCVNDSLLHFSNSNLPFGGIGHSGIGKSHGFFGFQEFTHQKAVLKTKLTWKPNFYFKPPYTKLKLKIISALIKYLP